jgi:hypothetical protein
MSIRDIIEAATPGPWFEDDPGDGNRLFVGNRADGRTHGLWQIVHMSSDRMCDLTEEAERRHRADNRFIATFDPEHVALMEAELQAGRHAWGFQHWPHAALAYNEARDALTAYRKERGL